MYKNSSQAIYRGAFGLFAAIVLGAFAAHSLKNSLPEIHLKEFDTAVKYQFYGCIGLILMGMLSHTFKISLAWPSALLRVGILIFCGTLYFLAIRPLVGIEGMNWIGAITPLGGICMMLAWVWTGISFYKLSQNEKSGEAP